MAVVLEPLETQTASVHSSHQTPDSTQDDGRSEGESRDCFWRKTHLGDLGFSKDSLHTALGRQTETCSSKDTIQGVPRPGTSL